MKALRIERTDKEETAKFVLGKRTARADVTKLSQN